MKLHTLTALPLAAKCLADLHAPPGHDARRITARQDAAAAAFTLTSRDAYVQSPTATAQPTGTEMLILPSEMSELPEGGVDFFMGPELAEAIKSAGEGHCADGATDDCINSLASALNQGRSYELETRVVGIDDLIVGGVLIGVLSFIYQAYELYHDDGGMTTHVHVPGADLAAVQPHKDTVIPVATSSGGEIITIPAAVPTSIEAGPTTASIFTLTADDSNGHPSGETVLAPPAPTADLMTQLLGKSGECPHRETVKRQIDYTGVNGAGAFMLPHAAPGQLLGALGLVLESRLPQLRDEAAQASWDTLRALTESLPEYADVSSSFRDTITSGVWASAYQWCIDALNEAGEIFLEESLWFVEDEAGGCDETGSCPADAPKGVDAPRCDDAQCLGDKGMCLEGAWKDCECLPIVAASPAYVGTYAEWNDMEYVAQELLKDEAAAPKPNPDAPYVEGTCSVDVQLDAWADHRDKLLPYWLQITSMEDAAQNTLEPTEEWVLAGASDSMTTTSKLEAVLELIPIKKPDADVPYIQFILGDQVWRSDQNRLDSGVPGCSVTPCLLCTDPMSYYYHCEFICGWGGGSSSNA